MRKLIKFLIGIGMLALIAGGIVLGIAIKTKAFVFEEIVTNEYVLEDDFSNISMDLDTANVHFELAEDSKTKVVCVRKEKTKYEVKVEDDKLDIKAIDTRKWYEHALNFDWNFQDLSVTLYLPKTTYDTLDYKGSTGDFIIDNKFTFNTLNVDCSTGYVEVSANVKESIKASCSTGDIVLKDMNLNNNLYVKASTGAVRLSDITCNNLEVKVSTGEVKLKNVVASKDLSISSSVGDIFAIDVDGDTISIKTSTGDIKLVVLTPKNFKATSSTGSVDVPDTTGKDCVLHTSTGSIQAEVK